MPATIEELVLPKSTPIINESNPINAPSISIEVLKEETFLEKIKDNDEVLLAWTIIPDMESTNQLAQKRMFNAINSPDKEKISLPTNRVTRPKKS